MDTQDADMEGDRGREQSEVRDGREDKVDDRRGREESRERSRDGRDDRDDRDRRERRSSRERVSRRGVWESIRFGVIRGWMRGTVMTVRHQSHRLFPQRQSRTMLAI